MKTKKERASWPMKDWEVRAILDGSKTQHRMPVVPGRNQKWLTADLLARSPRAKPVIISGEQWAQFAHPLAGQTVCGIHNNEWSPLGCVRHPHGKPGDRLWVRETWSTDFARHYPHEPVWYAADDRRHDIIEVRNGVRGIFSPESQELVPFRWHPSTHMFRWASRITLEIVSVRIERLRDISEADALAEGVSREAVKAYERAGVARPAGFAYRDIWIERYGVDSWDANNWVWVEEFKVVQP